MRLCETHSGFFWRNFLDEMICGEERKKRKKKEGGC